MARLTGDELAAWVARSCAASEVPLKVTDSRAVGDVAVLLLGRAHSPAEPGLRPSRSDPPHGLHPIGVEPVVLDGRRSDHDVVDHGLDDRALTGEVEVGPLSA